MMGEDTINHLKKSYFQFRVSVRIWDEYMPSIDALFKSIYSNIPEDYQLIKS